MILHFLEFVAFWGFMFWFWVTMVIAMAPTIQPQDSKHHDEAITTPALANFKEAAKWPWELWRKLRSYSA